LDVIGAFELISVGLLLEPGPLAGALADGPTFRLSTEALPTAVTRIGGKRGLAMQAIGQRRQTGHEWEEDAQRAGTEAVGGSGRRRRRRKKSWRWNPKKKEDAAKKTHTVVVFKPVKSDEFQNGGDTVGAAESGGEVRASIVAAKRVMTVELREVGR
jgi:hypothetical protein